MSATNSPNMALPIPSVGTQPGPDYALNINSSLTLIDQHDHSPGRGVQITPAGLDINADLSMGDNNLTNIKNAIFFAQTSSAQLQSLYVAPGSETPALQDLWYNDSAGNAVQITSGGLVNATIGSLPGQSYSAGTFIWKQGAGSTTPANFDIGSITIRPTTALTTNGVTLTPPSAIASAYSIALPALPGSNSIMAIDNSGNITTPLTVASLTPTNAGSQNQFARQSSSGAPTWSWQNATIKTKTSGYTALLTDDVILCSGSAFTVTLFTAVGNTGKMITIKKTDSSLTNIITITPNGGETINTYASFKLTTLNDSVTLYSDGTNWQISDHSWDTNWTDAGALTITAITTAPTKPNTGITIDKVFWRRDGKDAIVRYNYVQTSITGANNGTGDYLFAIPTGISVDTSVVTAFSTPVSDSAIWQTTNCVGSGTMSASTQAGALFPVVYDTTHLRLFYVTTGNQGPVISTAASLTSGNLTYAFEARIPVSGWAG